MKVTDDVLAAAGKPFPVEPVRTLDAIHLATAAAVSDAPQFTTLITRDQRVRANAEALGYTVEPPLRAPPPRATAGREADPAKL